MRLLQLCWMLTILRVMLRKIVWIYDVAIAENFAPGEMATRLTLAQTKLVFTQSTLQRQGKRLPLYNKVIAAKSQEAKDLIQQSVDQATEKAAELLTNSGLKEEIEKLKAQGTDLQEQVKQLQERLQVYMDELATKTAANK